MNCNILDKGLEGALIILILTLSYKIYKMKVKSHSKCCKDNIEIDTQNSGGTDPI